MAEQADRKVEIGVEGMTCASCSARVERALQSVPGVVAASVNLGTERASVQYDSTKTDPGALAGAIARKGYAPVVSGTSLNIEGMTCASCVRRVEKALLSQPGVVDASVNLATGRADVHYFPAGTDPAALAAAVMAAGYGASPVAGEGGEDGEARKQRTLATLRRDVLLAAGLALPVLLLSMGGAFFPAFHAALAVVSPFPFFWEWVQAGLSTAVLFGPGRRFFRPGLAAYRHLSPDMNSLVATGTGAAWLYSLLVLLLPGMFPVAARQVYFDSAAVVIAAVLLGKYLEELARGRASSAIRKLAGLQAREARVLRDGREETLPVEQVVRGDLVVVRPGERLPVDGVVREGTSHVDAAMVTGEPLPAARRAGDSVIGGTLNREGRIVVEATSVGRDTMLAHIIQLVERAQTGKLPIQGLADRVIRVFTPAVLVIALSSFGIWMLLGPAPAVTRALLSAVAVLVVACPCAMGLATPAAILVGTGRAAELGVLFRKGEALETLSSADTVLLDKTGTVTEGRPALTACLGGDQETLLRLAASVESASEHPLAHAVLEEARRRNVALLPAENPEAVPGQGIRARIAGRQVLVGSGRFLGQAGISTGSWAAAAGEMEAGGSTTVFVAADGALLGLLAIGDPLRPEAQAMVQRLRTLGFRIAMVTGDSSGAAEAVARQTGISEVHAGILPQGKAAVVRQLQEQGRRVVFVGDGINDAPALALADVGIALASGTDIAMEAGEVTLAREGLAGVVTAIVAARRTMAIIRGNLFWAFFYNILLIPVAAGAAIPVGIQLSPMLAGVAMGMSSVLVLGNSLRLRGLTAWETGKAGMAKEMSGPSGKETFPAA